MSFVALFHTEGSQQDLLIVENEPMMLQVKSVIHSGQPAFEQDQFSTRG